ncbi:TPA: hypothetical protein AABS01_001425 [Neisseria gonorrhoeae]|uniref:hypothetical protein n=1 Tax=Neisseria TaxID=482 RepID=UPI00140385D2|nr:MULTISPECIES: hypothetical protein [Neisseria]MCK2160592.1 hypothetical protein [Neisseria gonorrhoeae]MCK2163860.1 hypothetical protein [Neisseria gonorrhoeae]MCK2170380.1 hypothetical protein [Neisseria gonorrhoeae]MDO6014501.1 hypothetical protein [Neisseria gonorrhoeae]
MSLENETIDGGFDHSYDPNNYNFRKGKKENINFDDDLTKPLSLGCQRGLLRKAIPL